MSSTKDSKKPETIWVFGYGSLTWNPNFAYEEKVVGHVKGFARRFWQGSTDHRGVPGAPGRVVTLISAEEEITWGVAYKTDNSVLSYLDYREKDGYTTHKLQFYPINKETPPFTVLVYIATETNVQYLGPVSLDALARHIASSRGPSGCNVEYAMNLARTMREIAPDVQDKHLFDLEQKLREIIAGYSLGEEQDPFVCDSCEYHSPKQKQASA